MTVYTSYLLLKLELSTTRVKNLDAYANKYQREIVSDAILPLGNADHRILVWTGTSGEDLSNLSTQSLTGRQCVTACKHIHLDTDRHNILDKLLPLLLRAQCGTECQCLNVFRELH